MRNYSLRWLSAVRIKELNASKATVRVWLSRRAVDELDAQGFPGAVCAESGDVTGGRYSAERRECDLQG